MRAHPSCTKLSAFAFTQASVFRQSSSVATTGKTWKLVGFGVLTAVSSLCVSSWRGSAAGSFVCQLWWEDNQKSCILQQNGFSAAGSKRVDRSKNPYWIQLGSHLLASLNPRLQMSQTEWFTLSRAQQDLFCLAWSQPCRTLFRCSISKCQFCLRSFDQLYSAIAM